MGNRDFKIANLEMDSSYPILTICKLRFTKVQKFITRIHIIMFNEMFSVWFLEFYSIKIYLKLNRTFCYVKHDKGLHGIVTNRQSAPYSLIPKSCFKIFVIIFFPYIIIGLHGDSKQQERRQ